MCQYGNGTCGAFQALTQRGYLITDVANIGYISASYTITVRKRNGIVHTLYYVLCGAEWVLLYQVYTAETACTRVVGL